MIGQERETQMTDVAFPDDDFEHPRTDPPPSAFPLSAREVFAGLVLTGLTGRLQPIQHSSEAERERLVDLAFDLADRALARRR